MTEDWLGVEIWRLPNGLIHREDAVAGNDIILW